MPKRNSRDLAAMELLEQALELPSGEREDFIQGAAEPAAIRRFALRMLRRGDTAAEMIRTGEAGRRLDGDDEPIPERIGAYRVIERIGRGGMGSVYLAERAAGDFDHQVAIKLIRPGILTPSLVERFNRERQILAALNHPHIARLYDGGQTGDGAPYIVMEHVEGRPLHHWLREDNPSLGRRLDLLEQVLDAVGFAHAGAVIHRDLTPSNILVTANGSAKLIDFGIARPQDEEGAPTPVSPISKLSLTPGYAAPETEDGGPLTTLVDIHALGRIMEETVDAVDGEELAAIAAKAAAHDPAERYPTTEAMRRDLSNYRAGLPVEAFSQARSYRARKFLARNRVGVALASLAVVVLVAGVLLLTASWRTAERERDAAEQRFAQVRELSNFLLFDLYDQLEDVPGTTRSLNDIADRARQYLDTLARSEGTSPELRLEAALAYKRLADVLGTPLAANLGRREEAGEALDLSVSQLRALHREHPDNPAIAKGLGEALYSKAVFAFIALDDNEAAHLAATESAAIYRRFANGPRQREFALAAIDAEVEAALPLAWMGREADAVAALKQVFAELETHLEEFGRDAEGLGLLARTESALAETITRMADAGQGDYEEGLGYADRAIATYGRQAAISDKPEAVRRSQAISLFKRSLALYSLERDAQALADLERADTIIAGLREKDAGDMGLVGTHAAILEQKAITLAYLGRHDRARATARRATEAKRRRLRDEPGNPGLIRDLASNLAIVAEVAELGRRKAEACALYRESEQRMREFQRASEAVGSTTEPMIAALPESIARVC